MLVLIGIFRLKKAFGPKPNQCIIGIIVITG